jgi:hypothetical protein
MPTSSPATANSPGTLARRCIFAQAGVRFEHVQVHEGDEVRMGDVVLHFLETPGHAPESICILVFDMAKSREPERIQAHLERGRRHERLDRRPLRNLHLSGHANYSRNRDRGPGARDQCNERLASESCLRVVDTPLVRQPASIAPCKMPHIAAARGRALRPSFVDSL